MRIKEIPYDQFTPITVYHALATTESCILESTPGKDRYSFIGIDSMETLKGQGDYAPALRALRNKYQVDDPQVLYLGGAIGYVGYDQSYCFQVYRSAVIFDHQTGRAILATLGDEAELQKLLSKLTQMRMLPEMALEMGDVEVDRSDAEFKEMVEKAKEHLRAGDAYQIVLSRTFQVKMKGDPFQFYRALRKLSPAPFLFFLDTGSFCLAGASPEKIISVKDGLIEATPIAGTCPKGASVELLKTDPKELSEHVMLVDLARNDLGAVSVPGSVKVTEYQVVHEFSHVYHIVSKVVGRLRPNLDALDAFAAAFPAGTLTGAPKKRAMELIQEMEKDGRGVYGGGIVAIDAQGNLNSCIAIRTAVIEDGLLKVRAGAGIVLDSDPQKEADETRHKANTILGVAHAYHHR